MNFGHYGESLYNDSYMYSAFICLSKSFSAFYSTTLTNRAFQQCQKKTSLGHTHIRLKWFLLKENTPSYTFAGTVVAVATTVYSIALWYVTLSGILIFFFLSCSHYCFSSVVPPPRAHSPRTLDTAAHIFNNRCSSMLPHTPTTATRPRQRKKMFIWLRKRHAKYASFSNNRSMKLLSRNQNQQICLSNNIKLSKIIWNMNADESSAVCVRLKPITRTSKHVLTHELT